ncbi:hypothetical protein PybrP1_000212 [[Pythium] brassicae (nom. inval.)]|nr:hypothetical protein PybrP1_000212 [[Pythium] brassicae (nom. inval.)]
MTLGVPHARPTTSCGSVGAAKGIAIRSDMLEKKVKKLQTPVALVRSSRKARPDLPELVDSDDIDDTGATPTRPSAAVDRTLQLTTLLLSEQAKLSQQLLIASEKGNKHAAYLLLHQQIDRDRCKGMNGYSPLHYAATRGHLEVIHLLLDFGWSIDARNDLLETPLHLAAYSGHTPSAECLLDRGADVNALNSDGETPLFYAARKSHYRVVRLLVRRECDLAIKNRFGDVAEDDATREKTQSEFSVGREDAQRLYTLRSAPANGTRAVVLVSNDGDGDGGASASASSEQRISQMLREHVLSFLDLKSLCLASQASYRWHRAADSPSLWSRLGVSRWELLLNATMGIGAGGSRFVAPGSKRHGAGPTNASGADHRPQTARHYQ